MLGDETLGEIKLQLTNIFETANMPERMLAVYRHESSGLHCRLILYLTAEFQAIAELDNVVSSIAPPKADSAFLAGNKIN